MEANIFRERQPLTGRGWEMWILRRSIQHGLPLEKRGRGAQRDTQKGGTTLDRDGRTIRLARRQPFSKQRGWRR